MMKKHFTLLLISFVLMIVSACQTVPPTQPLTEAESATLTVSMEKNAQIKLSDDGRTFIYHLTDRFSVFLDDTKYPVKDLTCTPDEIIDTISNGSLRGPDRYPVMFEAIAEGKCLLKDRDFHVEISIGP